MMGVEEIESLRQAREVVSSLIRELRSIAEENDTLKKELKRQEKSISRLKRLVLFAFLFGLALGVLTGGKLV